MRELNHYQVKLRIKRDKLLKEKEAKKKNSLSIFSTSIIRKERKNLVAFGNKKIKLDN